LRNKTAKVKTMYNNMERTLMHDKKGVGVEAILNVRMRVAFTAG
jgi:hypothetical protein